MRGPLLHHQPKRFATLAALGWYLLSAALLDVAAQQLPLRHYKIGDGLAHEHVHHIYQDRYNYLWISTSEGLSRFNGYRFVNYDRRHGLGNQFINFVTEDRRGRLWVATNGGGLARLLDEERRTGTQVSPEKKFVTYLIGNTRYENAVNSMVFDTDNSLWCLTDAGLFRGREDSAGNLVFELIEECIQPIVQSPALIDSHGALWFGLRKGERDSLVLRVVSGHIFRYVLTNEVHDEVTAVCEDARGRVLATTLRGSLLEFQEEPNAHERGRWVTLPLKLVHPGYSINTYTMYVDASGAIWLGTNRGLVKYKDGKQIVYTTANGLSDISCAAITADREGNLWLGASFNGLSKLSSEQITSFTKAEGLPEFNVHNIFESRSGTVYAFSFTCCAIKFTDRKVEIVRGSESQLFNALWPGQVLLDHEDNWWFVTESGLYRFRGPELQFRRGEKMNAVLGLPETMRLAVMFYAPDKRIWLSTWPGVLYELELQPRPRLIRKLPLSDLNRTFTEGPVALLSDHRGALWLATRNQGLGRLFEGKLKQVQPTEGLPETAGRSLFQDSRGWLWIGLRNEGVSVLKDPGAEPLRFVNYSPAQKLTSNSVWSITEDNFGRIYLGTGKGLAQVDPGTGRTRVLTTADGLVGDNINICFKDSQGAIWVTTNRGVSRLSPGPPEIPVQPPPVYLSRVYAAGEDLALPERGVQRLPYFELAASRNNLSVEYEAVNFRGGTIIRYQYKLDGVDADWSAATDQRTVNFARLAPGKYRFLVRAINEAGLTSGPAQIDFRILPPLYMRWWFIAAVVTALVLTAYFLYQLRVKRLVEIERVRTRIATDLHDDVGANASLIAMLSEVAQQEAAHGNAKALDSLASIAGTARELIDSTSDIVWAVNPQKDRASELIKRMRRFASDALGSRGVTLRFTAPHDDYDFPLGADARREIYFVFKESINNIARHSGCSEVEINLSLEDGHLVMKLSDNGKGFDAFAEFEGNGLKSMRERARKLGAEFTLVSHPDSGCKTRLAVPLRHRGFS